MVLGRRLPINTGELRIRGLSAAVTIRRDAHGVPHIDAANEDDGTFALGFCQGQDRAAQLEVLWRVVRGRLAEWVGPKGLGADRMSRRIGFRRTAEKQLPIIAEPVRAQLHAFALGVSAGNRAGLSQKPHEFAILGGEPSAWDTADVLAVLKLETYLLPSNWDAELARIRILLADGPDAVIRLDPVGASTLRENLNQPGVPNGTRGTRPNTPVILEQLAADLARLQAVLPRGGGSNNWAINGSRTATGKPLLASDPHLAPTAPPPWYLGHIRCPEWEAAGAGFVGTPGFGIGHNGFAAWGVTAGLTDNSDLFVETLGADGKSVREADGSFTPCEVIREVIKVSGAADVIEEILVTPRGPVLTPVLENISQAVTLRAVWLDALPVNGFLGTVRARSFDEFRQPFEHWPMFPLNMLYADAAGTIGWQLVGQLPQRRGGTGLVPLPADLPGVGWSGLVPFEEMPFTMNPEAGFLATANNPVPGRPEFGADYCDEYRVQAISTALAARTGWTAAECLWLQQDVQCLPWTEIRDIVLSLEPTDADAQDGLKLLHDWHGRVEVDSAAAAIFELFTAEMCARVARVAAPNSWLVALGESGLGADGLNLFTDRRIAHLVTLIREQPAGWFTSWPTELCDALAMVMKKLRRDVGPGQAYWGWGHLRQLRLEHAILGKHRWLGPIFNLGPVPCDGDCNTISQAGSRPAHPTAFTHNMANLRTVFDLDDLSKSLFVLCGGQSGNPCSPNFGDQFPLWRSGEAITIAWDQPTVIRQAKQTLRLLPASD